ncbi:MAG: family 78 glycoside hydrolase catalytic domain [Lentisphaeria bacterium]|nr:family 78 glycoside hydrolase catalytic domain [Lentisphaeria bacterium]
MRNPTDSRWDLSDHAGPQWIFPARPGDSVNQYVDFLHAFDCDQPDPGAELVISADTDFIAWLNGTLIGHGQYSDYPDQKTYDRFSVGSALRQGSNTLAVTVFYNGRDSSVYRRGKPGVVFEIRGTGLSVISGTATRCRPNPSYHSGSIAIVSGQLAYTFGYDASREDNRHVPDDIPGGDWRRVAASEATCPPGRRTLNPRPVARLVDGGPTAARLHACGYVRRLTGGDQKPDGDHQADSTVISPAARMQTDFLSAVSTRDLFGVPFGAELADRPSGIRPISPDLNGHDGIYIIVDMGQEEAGHLEFEIDAPAGTILDIGYGEHLDDLRVRTCVGGRNFASRYICRQGRQTFTHRFLRWAGRYLQVTIQEGNFTLRRLHLRRQEYPVTYQGKLETNNSLHTAILDTCRRTLTLCMHEHYEDTPWREQALYANDARTQALCSYYAFGETQFPASSFSLLGRGLREDGFLELTAPARPKVTIPSFTLVWMLAVRDHYLYSGDATLARQFLPQIISMLTTFLTERRDGLLPLRQAQGVWHFYDWTRGLSGYGEEDFANGLTADAPLNCFLILALEAAREIIQWLGDDGQEYRDTEAIFSAAVDDLRGHVGAAFYRPDEEAFATHNQPGPLSELTQALAVLSRAGTEAMRENALARMAQTDSGLIAPGLSQSFYTFEALMTRKGKYGPVVLERIEKQWAHMLRSGATTFWETIKGAGDFSNAGSLCHGWSAVPLYVFFHHILGVRPRAPGFSAFSLDPMIGATPVCSGTVPVPVGEITVAWNYATGKQIYTMRAPDSCDRVELTD